MATFVHVESIMFGVGNPGKQLCRWTCMPEMSVDAVSERLDGVEGLPERQVLSPGSVTIKFGEVTRDDNRRWVVRVREALFAT